MNVLSMWVQILLTDLENSYYNNVNVYNENTDLVRSMCEAYVYGRDIRNI